MKCTQKGQLSTGKTKRHGRKTDKKGMQPDKGLLTAVCTVVLKQIVL